MLKKFSVAVALGALLLIASANVNAEVVTCKIKTPSDPGNKVFAPFDGGTFSLDLTSGSASLVAGSASQTLNLISSTTVSSFNADRKTCKAKLDVKRDAQGGVSAFDVDFSDCEFRVPQVPTYVAYVDVIIGYHFDTDRGV